MTIKHPLRLLSVPSLVVFAIELASWSVAQDFSDWGAWIDVIALVAAILVGHFFAATSPRGDSLEPAPFDRLLERTAGASFGAIPAAFIAGNVGFLRLDGLELAPALGMAHLGVLGVLAAAAFLVGLVLTALVYGGLTRVSHRTAAAVGCLLAVGAGAAVVSSATSDRIAFEAIQPSFTTSDEPPLRLDFVTHDVSAAGGEWVYVAVANTCGFVKKRGSGSGAVTVPARAHDDGFAVCPAIELRQSGDEVFGVIPGDQRYPVFTIKDKRVHGSVPDGVGAFGLMRELSVERASKAEKIGTIPSIRAARGHTSDEHEEGGLKIERNATRFQSCELRVHYKGQKVREEELAFSRTEEQLELCPGLRIVSSALLALSSARFVGDGRSDPPSLVLVHGQAVDRVRLADVASRFRAPAGWIAFAGVGTTAAMVLVVIAVVQMWRQRRWQCFELAHHEGDGTVAFEDGRRVSVPGAVSLPVGDIMVLGDVPAIKAGAYRSTSELPQAELEVWEAMRFRQMVERLDIRCLLAPLAAVALVLVSTALLGLAWAFGLR